MVLCELGAEEGQRCDSQITTAQRNGAATSNRCLRTLLTEEHDAANAITLHAGAGGTEAQDWCDALPDVFALGGK